MPFMKILSSAALYSVLSLGCVWVQVYLVWSDKPWTIFWQKIQRLSNSCPITVIGQSTYKVCQQHVQKFLSKVKSVSKWCPTKLNLDRHWTYTSRVCPYPLQKSLFCKYLDRNWTLPSRVCPTIFWSPKYHIIGGQSVDRYWTLD